MLGAPVQVMTINSGDVEPAEGMDNSAWYKTGTVSSLSGLKEVLIA